MLIDVYASCLMLKLENYFDNVIEQIKYNTCMSYSCFPVGENNDDILDGTVELKEQDSLHHFLVLYSILIVKIVTTIFITMLVGRAHH